MSRGRIARRVLVPLSVAALGLGMMSAPASASDYVCTSGCAGEAKFEPVGEHFYIADLKADGHSVVVRYVRHDICSPVTGRCQVNLAWNHNGANSVPVDHNMNIAEGVEVDWNVCLGEYGSQTILYDTCHAKVVSHA
ncbi:hypothetical protein [Actinocatenispora comari]|jgi:hypothetical protein|nr:hypothetical protein [Actinocatenispora comari]